MNFLFGDRKLNWLFCALLSTSWLGFSLQYFVVPKTVFFLLTCLFIIQISHLAFYSYRSEPRHGAKAEIE